MPWQRYAILLACYNGCAMSNIEATQNLIVGVDVGGTKTAVLVADRHHNPLGQITLPTVMDGAEAALQGIIKRYCGR